MKDTSRLIVVSNRLPVTISRSGSQLVVAKSSGGLVTALEPLLQRVGGCWIGWPGMETTPDVVQSLRAACHDSFELRPVSISAAEHRDFYAGCSNEIIWPLFHDNISACRFEPECWESYRDVTEYFADAVEATATPRDFVWVHDYHLMLVASALRARDSRLKLAYFHHIPFPSPDIFGRLPWREELLTALLDFNQLGFQTRQDRRNFVTSLRRWLPGKVQVRRLDSNWLVSANGRTCTVANHPISIDFQYFSNLANHTDVIAECDQIRRNLPFQSIILGVDRLDYTKGILERLHAFLTFLEQNPEQCGLATLIQLLIPSREDVPVYRALRASIEQSISEINGRFGRPGWTPVVYMYRSVSPCELAGLYRAAAIALITPLRDGMNLVSKEFCASRDDDSGVLILSEFAGAAEELSCGAILVNPHDRQQIADALCRALDMPRAEISQRMSAMRETIRQHDVWDWFARCCDMNVLQRSYQQRHDELRTALRSALVTAANVNGTLNNLVRLAIPRVGTTGEMQ
jgi:trehalose 6-phosphate synthase/phosphatase